MGYISPKMIYKPQIYKKILNIVNHCGNANQNHNDILPYTQ